MGFERRRTMRTASILLILLAGGAGQDPRAEHVVLVSIDGLRPEFYLGGFETPAMQAMMRDGAHAKAVESVYPSVTYAAHASIVTGVRPWKHGIYANTQWGERGTTRDWYWHAKDLKARTLWQAAREKKLKVAITYWPVSVGAEADWVLGEIWDPDARETPQRLNAAATPGLLVELSLALGIPKEKIAEDKAAIDAFVSRAAAYVFRKYKPHLQLIHLLNVDEVQHRQGREGEGVREAVRRQDENLSRIRKGIEDSGLKEKTLLVVVGDHGFTDVSTNINPNALLRDAGYVDAEGDQLISWRALARSSGGSAAIYVKDRSDTPAVTDLFRKAAVHEGKAIYRILGREELDRLGYNPEAAFGLEPERGWAFSGAITPLLVYGLPTVKGNHGQLPSLPELKTGFLACGAGVKAGAALEHMRLIDVAPTVARVLGLEMPGVEGVPLEAILR
jgi:predicted AlkP superfamily pyrophosphatase or phosphodiesterase